MAGADDLFSAARDLMLEVHGEASIFYVPAAGGTPVALASLAIRQRRSDDDSHRARVYTYSIADYAPTPRRNDVIRDSGEDWLVVAWQDPRGGSRIVDVELARLHSHEGV